MTENVKNVLPKLSVFLRLVSSRIAFKGGLTSLGELLPPTQNFWKVDAPTWKVTRLSLLVAFSVCSPEHSVETL